MNGIYCSQALPTDLLGVWSTLFANILSAILIMHLLLQCEFATPPLQEVGSISQTLRSRIWIDLWLTLINEMQVKWSLWLLRRSLKSYAASTFILLEDSHHRLRTQGYTIKGWVTMWRRKPSQSQLQSCSFHFRNTLSMSWNCILSIHVVL